MAKNSSKIALQPHVCIVCLGWEVIIPKTSDTELWDTMINDCYPIAEQESSIILTIPLCVICKNFFSGTAQKSVFY